MMCARIRVWIYLRPQGRILCAIIAENVSTNLMQQCELVVIVYQTELKNISLTLQMHILRAKIQCICALLSTTSFLK